MEIPSLSLLEQILKLIIALAGVAGLATSALGSAKIGKQSESIEKLISSSNLSADAKQGIARRLKNHRLLQIAILAILSIAAIASISLFAFSSSPDREFFRSLEQRDSAIFSDSKAGNYHIARLLPDRASLHNDTDLRNDINASKSTFDMYANTAGFVLRSNNKQIEDLVKRGVHVRFLLSDSSDANHNIEAHSLAVKENPTYVRAEIAKSKDILDKMIARFKADPDVYRGVLEVRYTNSLLLYTSWLRDRNTSDAVAHIELQFHGGKDKWPSFRFGKDSGRLVNYLATEYENLWNGAKLPSLP